VDGKLVNSRWQSEDVVGTAWKKEKEKKKRQTKKQQQQQKKKQIGPRNLFSV